MLGGGVVAWAMFYGSIGAVMVSGREGPVVFRFSSEYDDSSTALETIVVLVSLSTVLFCRRVNTGSEFIFSFSFHSFTGATYPCACHHSFSLSIIHYR